MVVYSLFLQVFFYFIEFNADLTLEIVKCEQR